MHCTLPREHLLRLLDLVGGGADPDLGTGVPLFTHVRLDCTNALAAATIASDRAAKATVPAAIDRAGRCGVPLRRFTQVVKSFTGDTIVLDQTGGRLRVAALGGSVALPVLPDADLDALHAPWTVPLPEDAAIWSVEPAKLAAAITAARYACGKDGGRPALTGVLLDVSERDAFVVATDAARLVRVRLPGAATRASHVILPSRSLDAVVTALEAIPDARTNLDIHPTGLWLDAIGVVGVLVHGLQVPYPNYGAVLTRYSESATTACVDRETALACAKRAALVADKETSVKLAWTARTLTWTLAGPSGDLDAACEILSAMSTPHPDPVPFNPKLLVDAIEAIPGDALATTLRVDGANPIALDLRPNGDPDTLHLVLRRAQ